MITTFHEYKLDLSFRYKIETDSGLQLRIVAINLASFCAELGELINTSQNPDKYTLINYLAKSLHNVGAIAIILKLEIGYDLRGYPKKHIGYDSINLALMLNCTVGRISHELLHYVAPTRVPELLWLLIDNLNAIAKNHKLSLLA